MNQETAVASTLMALQAEDDPPQDDPPAADEPTDEAPGPTEETPPTKTPKPCNDALFISETVPDDSEYEAGDPINKSWRFKNTGTCTWNTDYKLVFKSGDQMGAPAQKPLSGDVAPGETVDISVNMTAPAAPGTYQGYWKLVDDEGENLINNVWAKIKVTSDPFAVTSVSITAIPPVFVGPCPFPFTFNAEITVNGPGTVTYFWEREDSGQFGHASVAFASAGSKIVNTVWPQVIPGAHWMKIYIDEPNHQYLGKADYTVNCIP